MAENGYIILNSGAQLPKIGLGTWRTKGDELEAAVKCAISEGYRHIDCAHIYANEEEIGKGIAAKIHDGTIKREELFLTSKLNPAYNEPDKVELCCKESLQKLGVDYLDLYLIHWPVAMKGYDALEDFGVDVPYTDTWKAMEALVTKGYCKNIGVSNFNKTQLEKICSICTIKPVVNQVEVHPYLTNTKLAEYCKSKDITVIAYSPFASPDKGRPLWKEDDPKPLEDPNIIAIASKHNVLPSQVILKWLIQRRLVTIPKSVTPERIRTNIQLKHFNLTPEDMEKITGLNMPFRFVLTEMTPNSKYYPFKDEY